ncbi:MAG: NAD(P)-dependent glycerol-3-phosphate dehydrogenase [Gammaproteobacteria bacterium]|nr:NAD(P)-dependent glycerol-3-phosphate dehydrogenase [Gammaproteobacteria bacterium]
MKQEAVAVLGAGAWGTALAMVLAQNNHRVHLWEFDHSHYEQLKQQHVSRYLPGHILPDTLLPFCDLAESLENVRDVLVVVPSHVFQTTLMNLRPLWKAPMRLAWATKGLIPPNRLAQEVINDVLGPQVERAIVTGPTFANEVAQGLPSAVLVASPDKAYAKAWAEKLSRPYFHVETSQDMVGAQVAGVVKNVLAIATGMCDGLGYGANTRCALMTRGLQEMIRLGEVMGAKKDTFLTVAGVGDLILTCTDNQSRNRRFGLALGQGQTVEEAQATVGLLVEGYHNTQALQGLAEQYQLNLPIIRNMYEVLTQGLAAKTAVEQWW